MLLSTYKEVPNYDKENVKKQMKKNNLIALIVFCLYFGGISVIGYLFLTFEWFDKPLLYLVFFAINFADYFCIVIWCPFSAIFFKNSCCNTCRISNWDRLMKFAILIFIPNIFTITIFILGLIIFGYWEYQHQKHPERFYRVSNEMLWCRNCDKETCEKKMIRKDKKE